MARPDMSLLARARVALMAVLLTISSAAGFVAAGLPAGGEVTVSVVAPGPTGDLHAPMPDRTVVDDADDEGELPAGAVNVIPAPTSDCLGRLSPRRARPFLPDRPPRLA